MFEWLLKKQLERAKPTLVFFAGDWGKSMAMASTLSVLRSRAADAEALSDVRDVSRSLLTLRQPSLVRAFIARLFKSRPYPTSVCLEVGGKTTWPAAQTLQQAGRIVLVITSLATGQDAKAALKELVARFGDAKESLIIVYNAEVPGLADALSDAAKEQTTFAIDQLADLRAMNIETITHGPETGETLDGRWRGMSCKVQTSGSTVPLQIFSGIGRYHVLAGLCALAVGQALGANTVEALQALRAHTPLPGRMSLIPGIKKSMLVDDSYDTDALTLAQALQEVAALPLPAGKKRIAVIGEMPETGAQSASIHCAIGELLAGLPFDMIVGVGERTTDLLSCASRAGIDQNKLVHFNDKYEAGKFVQHALRKGELVLVKGSKKEKLESVVKELMAFPLKAKQDLLQR